MHVLATLCEVVVGLAKDALVDEVVERLMDHGGASRAALLGEGGLLRHPHVTG